MGPKSTGPEDVENKNDHTFITVKYGDNKEAIFNPWCHSYILLECIRRKCECGKEITIDLVDTCGHVSDLHDKTLEYASDYVTGRETYVLISIEKQDHDKPTKFTSLLTNLEEVNPELQAKLDILSRKRSPLTKVSRESTKNPSSSIMRKESASSASSWNNVRRKLSVTRAMRGVNSGHKQGSHSPKTRSKSSDLK